MASVPKGAQSAKKAAVRTVPEYDIDPEEWHRGARTALRDLIAASEDAVRPLDKRQLGRLEHIRLIAEAGSALYDFLDHLPGGPRR